MPTSKGKSIYPRAQCTEIGMPTQEGFALIPKPPKECGLMAMLKGPSSHDKKIHSAIKRGISHGIIKEVTVDDRIILNCFFSLSSVGILFQRCTVPRSYICHFVRYTNGKKKLTDFSETSLNNSISKLEVNNRDWKHINTILKMPDPLG